MKKLGKILRTGREGATLVTVIIAAAFLIAVGVVVLAVTTRYLVSVYMDRNTTDNLYDAEGILAEVKSGLLQYAGDSGKESYQMVLENYDAKKGNLNSEFGKAYLTGIARKIDSTVPAEGFDDAFWTDVSNSGKSAFRPVNKETLAELTDVDNAEEVISTRYNLKTKEGIEVSPDDSSDDKGDLGYYIAFSSSRGYYMTIRNLVVDYTDDAGYRSTIETDIQMTVPDYKFEGNSLFDEAKEYVVITDKELDIAGSATTGTTSIGRSSSGAYITVNMDGNIFTGADDVNVTPKISSDNTLENALGVGVRVNPDVTANFNCSKFVSRGDLDCGTNSVVSLVGNDLTSAAYVKNIRTLKAPSSSTARTNMLGAEGTDLTVNTKAYVENDLDIRDGRSTVTLGGTYHGYSYNETNTYNATRDISQADFSSAILVNGPNAVLKSSDLDSLILAGRAYVERGDDSKLPVNDIMLGQSIATKSDQVAYMVPDAYIKAGHNPVTKAQAGGDGWSNENLVNIIKKDKLLNEFSYSEDGVKKYYLNETYPVTGNFRTGEGGAGEPYVFLYLNFKNQDMANKYFKKYYMEDRQIVDDPEDEDNNSPIGWNKETLNERAQAYITGDADGAPFLDPAYYLLSGMVIKNYYKTTENFWDAKDRQDDGTPNAGLLKDGITIGKIAANIQNSLSPAGDKIDGKIGETDDRMRLHGSDRSFLSGGGWSAGTINYDGVKAMVSEKMFDFDQIKDVSAKTSTLGDGRTTSVVSSTGDVTVNDTLLGEGNELCLVVSGGDVTVSAKCNGLIIAKGNVYVDETGGFSGLILAGGDIRVLKTVDMQSDIATVDLMFTLAQTDEDLKGIFRNLSEEKLFDETEINKCLRYLNWEKNAY